MKTINYEGYQASVEYEDGVLFVKVLHIDDLLIGQCDSASDAQGILKQIIDEYLLDCAELKKDPAKPFKGSFNVRVTPEIHRRAAMAAAEAGLTLNAWVNVAIGEKLECSNLTKRVDNVFAVKLDEIQLLHTTHKANLHHQHDQTRAFDVSVRRAYHLTDLVETQVREKRSLYVVNRRALNA